MHCFVFLSLLSHYSTAVFTRVPFFDRKAKGVKGLGPFSDLWLSELANEAIFGKKHQKIPGFYQVLWTKPLQVQKFWTYPWKDNIHIFHLAPTFFKSSHRYALLWWLLEKSGLMWRIPDIKKYLQFFRPLRCSPLSLPTPSQNASMWTQCGVHRTA